MPPNGHALLSASSSDRWLHCPPSARLCESYADKGSDYAAEGTDAHALCEYKLRQPIGDKRAGQVCVRTEVRRVADGHKLDKAHIDGHFFSVSRPAVEAETRARQ